jgi:hypothetical protein
MTNTQKGSKLWDTEDTSVAQITEITEIAVRLQRLTDLVEEYDRQRKNLIATIMNRAGDEIAKPKFASTFNGHYTELHILSKKEASVSKDAEGKDVLREIYINGVDGEDYVSVTFEPSAKLKLLINGMIPCPTLRDQEVLRRLEGLAVPFSGEVSVRVGSRVGYPLVNQILSRHRIDTPTLDKNWLVNTGSCGSDLKKIGTEDEFHSAMAETSKSKTSAGSEGPKKGGCGCGG